MKKKGISKPLNQLFPTNFTGIIEFDMKYVMMNKHKI